MPQTDTYIEKETSINEEIDRLRLRATTSLFERRDVLVVASVSCIYGLGSPEAFFGMLQFFRRGSEMRDWRWRCASLVAMQYERTQMDLVPGSFRVRGDVLEILPAYDERGVRVEYFGDEIERTLSLRRPCVETSSRSCPKVAVYPRTHYVTPADRLEAAIEGIGEELEPRLADPGSEEGKLLERQRLEQRTRFDLEMLKEIGYCHGIENYSRHLSGRVAGEPPPTLLDYLPDDFLLVVDESHQTVPQVRAMYHGDRSRKGDAGRLRLSSAQRARQSAADLRGVRRPRRPADLCFGDARTLGAGARRRGGGGAGRAPDGSARPGDRGAAGEASGRRSAGRDSCRIIERGERVLVTTLTKRMAEELTTYLQELGIRVRYLHSDIVTPWSGSRSSPRYAAGSSMCWWGSTCCARDSTSRRSPWWLSWMPTRRASCAARPR